MILEAIEAAGYRPGDDIRLALDVASTELFKDGAYHFEGEGVTRTAEEMIALLRRVGRRLSHRLHRGSFK